MRDPEELAADISGYKIVVMPTVKTFELRSIEDAKRHFETHPEAAGILEKLPVEKMRFPSEIRSGNPHPKTDNYNICRMENHIRETWTCGEIIMFRSFTETGTFKPYEAASMKRIFDGLNNEVHIFMGAAAVLGEMNAKMCCGIFTDDGAILGLTINELRQLFNGKQTVLARLDKLENGLQKMPTARTVAAASREGARLALDEDPCTHRKKGGGRKPKYQNGKNQVLEVLKEVCTAKTKKASALAYSETVFNRWARSKKPHGYTSAKSLDSRVRDYLKANELPDLLDDTAKEKIKAHLDRLQKPHAVTK